MNKGTQKISVEHAEIKTATVEIKQLTVNARKMTLSVFRQIPREDLVNPATGELNGVVWGHVNYWWDGCGYTDTLRVPGIPDVIERSRDMHVLWQEGVELKRDIVGGFRRWGDNNIIKYLEEDTSRDIHNTLRWAMPPHEAEDIKDCFAIAYDKGDKFFFAPHIDIALIGNRARELAGKYPALCEDFFDHTNDEWGHKYDHKGCYEAIKYYKTMVMKNMHYLLEQDIDSYIKNKVRLINLIEENVKNILSGTPQLFIAV